MTPKADLEPELKAIPDVMLSRANLTIDDVLNASVRNFVAANQDLLTEADRQRFKGYL